LSASTRPTLILGSASPRRKDLLTTVGLTFQVLVPEVEEKPRPGEAPLAYALRNAREKSEWIRSRVAREPAKHPEGAIVISADTIVVLDDAILEKPRDRAHAVEMLALLQGRTHTVISGVTLASALVPLPKEETFAVTTEVELKPMSPSEIAAYVQTGEPLDKAGGYAAQGIGSYMVRSIRGSYANVVGLPVAEVVERLAGSFAYSLWGDTNA
jgi:septum formation protein